MPIKFEAVRGRAFIARVYEQDEPKALDPWISCFVLESAETPGEVWIKAFRGRVTRKALRELLEALVESKVVTILANRAEGHSLPFGVQGPDGITRIQVSALVARFSPPGDTGWAAL